MMQTTMIVFTAMMWLAVANAHGAASRLFLGKQEGEVLVQDRSGKTVFRNRDAKPCLEYALQQAKTVMVTEGEYNCSSRVDVPRSDVTLVIGQNATVRPAEGADMGAWPVLKGLQENLFRPLIYNQRHDNVRIVNLGTLIAPDSWSGRKDPDLGRYNSSAAIWFDGRPDGVTAASEAGMKGGLVYSPGNIIDLDKHGHGVAIHNAESVCVPFLYSSNMGHAVLWLEGTRNCAVGTVVNIPQEGSGEGESADLNAFNQNTTIGTVVGLGYVYNRQDEVLDINASPNTLVGQVVGLSNIRRLVNITNRAGNRFAKGKETSEGTVVGERYRLAKSDIEGMKKVMDAPEDLKKVGDCLNVTVHFIVTIKQDTTFKYGGTQHIILAD